MAQMLVNTYVVLKFSVTIVNLIANLQKPLLNHVKYLCLEYPEGKIKWNKDKWLNIDYQDNYQLKEGCIWWGLVNLVLTTVWELKEGERKPWVMWYNGSLSDMAFLTPTANGKMHFGHVDHTCSVSSLM